MSERISFDEFVDKLACRINESDLRPGQTAYNYLHLYRPDLCKKIMALGFDPYYDDTRLPEFYNWLSNNWEN